ncbi:MAG: permease, partial [Pseudomonadota bacterium]
MSDPQSEHADKPKQSTLASVMAFLRPRSLVMLVFGFSSGLPFYLIFQTLSIWLREADVSKSEIG